jgi:pimeloyl-ACP methyl ester carboxylesterase
VTISYVTIWTLGLASYSVSGQYCGQIDYPNRAPPYPVALILHHRCAGQRRAYQAHTDWALMAGLAAFRYDRLTEGQATAIAKADALSAYQVALSQPDVDSTRPVIIAQSVGTLILASVFKRLSAIQQPLGCVLLSNVLSGRDILEIKARVLVVVGEHDIFGNVDLIGPQAVARHNATYNMDSSCYIAKNADHCLV